MLMKWAAAAMLALSSLCAHAQADPGATYRNPLALRLPGGEVAQNCADPALLRERGTAAPSWYLFCTMDPISATERDGQGWKFHMMPVYRSPDLVHWDFVGDAFDARPATAGKEAGLWAPEPVYFNGQYYLYFTITDVADALSPEPGCKNDSAIGVATSASPAGPWKASPDLVVAPRRAAKGCEFHWTFDPEVVVTGEGDKFLYYGSYGGGIFVQRLTEDGMGTAGEPVRVGAAGRYEGAEVVRHGDAWYLFASATNCCNGPLTGYAVFVGRATRPEGPFLDRLGNDMAHPRVGGTPLLVQNGNRWVGSGHNTVFQDEAGQWWTIYHAVDRHQPYFSVKDRLTRRLALLDRIDWIDGWPVAARGHGPSDEELAAPAVRQGRASPPQVAATRPVAARLLWSEAFRDARLPRGWRWHRPRAAGEWSAARRLVLATQKADLHQDTNTASLLLHALPARGDYRIEMRMQLDAPDDCCAEPVQAGLVVWADDDRYVKLVELAQQGLRQIEFAKEQVPAEPGYARYGNTVVGTPGASTWLRLDVQREGAEERYTAYSSQDGRNWVGGAAWTHQLGSQPRLGLVAMGGSGYRATIERVAVYALPH